MIKTKSKEEQSTYNRKMYIRHRDKYIKRRHSKLYRDKDKKYYKENKKEITRRSERRRIKLIDNKEEIKKRKKYGRSWYLKNKKSHNEHMRIYISNRKFYYMILRKTNHKYPIKNEDVCKTCNTKKMLQHHHITDPIEVDEFIILCSRCHKKTHRSLYI